MNGFSLSGLFSMLKDKFMIVVIVVMLVLAGVIAAFVVPAVTAAIDKGKTSSGSVELIEFDQYNGTLKQGSDVVAAILQYSSDPTVGVAIRNGASVKYAENKIGALVAYPVPTSGSTVGTGAAVTTANQITYHQATNKSVSATYINPKWNYKADIFYDTAGAPALIVFTRQ